MFSPRAGQLFSLTRETQQNKADITALQRELRDTREELRKLAQIVQQLRFSQQRDRENEAQEREKLLLRRENWLLRFEQRLPKILSCSTAKKAPCFSSGDELARRRRRKAVRVRRTSRYRSTLRTEGMRFRRETRYCACDNNSSGG